MKTTPASCPSCGETMPPDAPQGLCPRCLLRECSVQEPPPKDVSLEEVRARFPDFEILELVGVGGMGRVYRARDPQVDRIVALKILAPDRHEDPEWIERFTREARALARLNHPHIVQVHRFGTAPLPHLVMEYVDGVNLRQAMQAGGLSACEALVIVPKLCDALHYAHENGVLHRDIKPENILVDGAGRVKIVDFGLAKLRDDRVPSFTLTQSGARLGTLAYMAPEQVEKPSEVDHRADLYSLGVVFYEMLTGELPLGRFPAPSEAGGTDPRLDAVVLRTLEKKKENRFPDAGAMRSGIETASTTPPPRTTARRELSFDFRTRAKVKGWPLLHVAFGRDPETEKFRHARGIVAIGTFATGGVAVGVFARGVVSWGVLSVGLFSSGVLALGVVSLAVMAVGLFGAAGVISLAPYSFGVTAVGYVAAGVQTLAAHAADFEGPNDPHAARLGNRWLEPSLAWQNWTTRAALTVLMAALTAAAWQCRHRGLAAIFLAFSLVGLVATTNWPAMMRMRFDDHPAVPEPGVRPTATSGTSDPRQFPPAPVDPAPAPPTQRWITEVSRTDDGAAKERALGEILEAISSEEPARNREGLRALLSLGEVRFDRTPFRAPLRRLVGDENLDWEVRGGAISGLFATGYEAGDVTTLVGLVESAPLDQLGTLAGALGQVSGNDFTGEYSAPFHRLLQRGFAAVAEPSPSSRPFDARGILSPVWGARVSPEIEDLVEKWSRLDVDERGLIRVGGRGYDAFYFALSVIANKGSVSVRRLAELANHPDATNVAGRCFWGLKGTIADPADRRFAAASALATLRERNHGYLWRQGLELLELYATAEHLPALRELASLPELPGERAKSLQAIVERLQP